MFQPICRKIAAQDGVLGLWLGAIGKCTEILGMRQAMADMSLRDVMRKLQRRWSQVAGDWDVLCSKIGPAWLVLAEEWRQELCATCLSHHYPTVPQLIMALAKSNRLNTGASGRRYNRIQ